MSKKYTNQFLCSWMMLPEHRTKLARHRQETERAEQHRHLLFDQQQWEEFQAVLERSYFEGIRVKVTTLEEDGHRTVTGVVRRLLPALGTMELAGAEGRQQVTLRRVVEMAEISGEGDTSGGAAPRPPVFQPRRDALT